MDKINAELRCIGNCTYLNTGAAGPIPQTSSNYILESTIEELNRGRVNKSGVDSFFNDLEQLKSEVGLLLNCSEEEVAITSSTTEGINIILWGLDLKEGDEVITTSEEHAGALAGLFTLAKRKKINVRIIENEFSLSKLAKAITDRTKLIIMSHVSWITGEIFPIKSVAEIAHKYKIKTLIDGAQSAGNIRVDIEDLGVDFYAIPAQKWLLGPEGVGALFIKSEQMDAVEQTIAGPFSYEKTNSYFSFEQKKHAGKYEIGTRYRSLLGAWLKSLKWLRNDIGQEVVFKAIEANGKKLREHLSQSSDYQVIQTNQQSGIVTIQLTSEHIDSQKVVDALEQKNIFVRAVPLKGGIRVCASFYNNDNDFIRLRKELKNVIANT